MDRRNQGRSEQAATFLQLYFLLHDDFHQHYVTKDIKYAIHLSYLPLLDLYLLCEPLLLV